MTLCQSGLMENLPAFPRLIGPLGRLADAITDDIPYEFRALAALTYVGLALSGRTKFAVDYDNIQSRWFACLIGPANSGKSASINEVEKALSPSPFGPTPDVRQPLGKVHILKSINSEAALSLSLANHSRLLWLPDEASGAFDKAKSGRMFHTILRLLEHNEAGHVVRDKSQPGGVRETRVRDGHFAMLMGATPQVFVEMWTGSRGAGSGLQSRFVLAYSEKKMPDVRTGSDLAAVKAATDELYDLLKNPIASIDLPLQKGDFTRGLTDGVDTEDTRAVRVVEMGRRFVLMLAACNKQDRIEAGDEVLQLGREFIQYQIAAYERFMPVDASNDIQRFEGRILTFFQRHDERCTCHECSKNDSKGAHTEREVRNNLRPENSPGGLKAFIQAFNTLAANETADRSGGDGKYIDAGHSGELVKVGRKGMLGSILWKLNPNRNLSDPRDHLTDGERTAKEMNDRLLRIGKRVQEGPTVSTPSVQVRDPLPTVPTPPPVRPSVDARDPGPTPPTVVVKDDGGTKTQVAQEERPPESLYDDLLEEP